MGYTDPKKVAAKLTHVFVTLTLVVLGLRVVFSLLDADLTNSFIQWVYATSVSLMQPFRGIFSVEVSTSQHVLELPVLFAMAAYAVLGVMVLGLIAWVPEAKKAKK